MLCLASLKSAAILILFALLLSLDLYGTSSFELDMLFILDTSSGVSLEDYDIQKTFVQRITMHLGIFNRQSRAAVVAYGANSFVVFSFGGYNSNLEFARLLKEARMFGGERRVDRALDTASAVMLNARSSKPKVVLLISAGKQSNASDVRPLKDAVLPLRHLGAWLYLIAFGQEDASDFLQVTIKPTDIFFSRFFSGPAVYGYIAPVARHIANTSGKKHYTSLDFIAPAGISPRRRNPEEAL